MNLIVEVEMEMPKRCTKCGVRLCCMRYVYGLRNNTAAVKNGIERGDRYHMSEWIKCRERLPYNDQMVLVPIINKEIPFTEILICRYIKCERPMFRHYGFRGIKDFIDVTHWMPLPDAPEVEGC